jgi:hypothetical protein
MAEKYVLMFLWLVILGASESYVVFKAQHMLLDIIHVFTNQGRTDIKKPLHSIQKILQNSSKASFWDILYGRLQKPRGICRIATMASPPLLPINLQINFSLTFLW